MYIRQKYESLPYIVCDHPSVQRQSCLQKLYKRKSPVLRPGTFARRVKGRGGQEEQGSWRCVQGSESSEGPWNLRQKEREVKPLTGSGEELGPVGMGSA